LQQSNSAKSRIDVLLAWGRSLGFDGCFAFFAFGRCLPYIHILSSILCKAHIRLKTVLSNLCGHQVKYCTSSEWPDRLQWSASLSIITCAGGFCCAASFHTWMPAASLLCMPLHLIASATCATHIILQTISSCTGGQAICMCQCRSAAAPSQSGRDRCLSEARWANSTAMLLLQPAYK
jgi:hypothetical protein